MRIGIVGCGSIALGYAAMLTESGHQTALWSPSGKSADGLIDAELEVQGAINIRFRPTFAANPNSLMDDAQVILVAVPGYAHQQVINTIVPFARNGQTFIVSAQLSLSALYLANQLKAHDITADVIAWATTVLMARRTGTRTIQIGGIRQRLEAAVLSEYESSASMAICRTLFGERFAEVDDIISIALSNLNPPIHLASALCNFTRIEKGEYWANYDGITPSVARMIEVLDTERLNVAAAYGVSVRTVHDHYRMTFGFGEGMSLAEMAAAVHHKRNGPPGPVSLETRFITEDVPFGIVPLIALAEKHHVPVPVHKAGVTLVNALYGRDFAQENDLLSTITAA